MSRIVFVNSVCYGSTGNICKELYKLAEEEGHECCIAYARGKEPEGYNNIKIGTTLDVYAHATKARIFDTSGLGSKYSTQQFVKWLYKYKPDIIHMHNLHGYYLNFEIFFEYLKKHPEIKKIWTLHDCWSYTGHCAHYLRAGCYQWKEKCKQCQQRNTYPKAFISRAQKNFEIKKRTFCGVENMVIIPVSEWLEKQVKSSFLREYETEIIISGIDTEIFRYRDSNFRKVYGLGERKIILGVASVWDDKKGLDDFKKLSNLLSEDYVLVLVGLNKKQIDKMNDKIIGIERTDNPIQLAEIYSAADVFFNPTQEETFGLTNVEAQACGTTVVSYIAGGTIETLVNSNTYAVETFEDFLEVLSDISLNKVDKNDAKKLFDKGTRMVHYLKYYSEREREL